VREPLCSRIIGRIAPARRAHGDPPAPMPAQEARGIETVVNA
jgi:hypothetical protein